MCVSTRGVLVVALCDAWVPLSVSRQRITCLGAMRPCIRQVELQGEFCNTWPVSLSHLCGWRKKERERRRGGERGCDGGGQHKQLGVIGQMSDNEKWLKKGERTTAGGAGGRRNGMTLPSYFFFLMFPLFLWLSLIHLSVPALHSAASQTDPAESPRSSLLTPSTLKVINTILVLSNARTSSCFMSLRLPLIHSAFLCIYTQYAFFVPQLVCCWKDLMPALHIHINRAVFFILGALSWWSPALEEEFKLNICMAGYSFLASSFFHHIFTFCICLCVFSPVGVMSMK